MIKNRWSIWVLFVVFCLALSFVLTTIVPAAITFIVNFEVPERVEQENVSNAITDTDQIKDDTEKNDDGKEEAFSKLFEIVSLTSMYVGVIIVIYGIFNFIFSFVQEDRERISRAVPMIVIGFVLIGMKTIIPMILGG